MPVISGFRERPSVGPQDENEDISPAALLRFQSALMLTVPVLLFCFIQLNSVKLTRATGTS
mgnify:CR=1 FL=1